MTGAYQYHNKSGPVFEEHPKSYVLCCFDILARMSPIQVDQFLRSRRRTIAIQILPNGQVIVRAPLRAPEKLIREFVESKAAWIERKKAEALKHAAVSRKQFRAGERFLFLGREYPLAVVEKQRAALTLEGGFILSRAALPKAGQAFEKW